MEKDFYDIYDLFEEYDETELCVSDLNIIVNGTRVDYITLDCNDEVHVWAGIPYSHYSEEILDNKKEVLEQVLEMF